MIYEIDILSSDCLSGLEGIRKYNHRHQSVFSNDARDLILRRYQFNSKSAKFIPATLISISAVATLKRAS